MPATQLTETGPADLAALMRIRAAELGARTVAVCDGSSVSYRDLATGAAARGAAFVKAEDPLAWVELQGAATDLVRLWGALISGRHVLATPRRAFDGPLLESAREVLSALPDNSSPHVLVSSSGTAGRPGVAAFPLAAVLARGALAARDMARDEVCAVATLRSLRGITEALGVVRRRARLAILPTAGVSAMTIARDVCALGVTRWTCFSNVLAAVTLCWEAVGIPDRLRVVDVRGEELTVALARSLLTAKPDLELWHTYGLTESGQGCSWRVTCEDLGRSFVPIGSTYDDPHVTIAQAHGAEGFGEITIRDKWPPTVTHSATGSVAGWERAPAVVQTADRGRILADGAIEYGGRMGAELAGARGPVCTRTAALRVMEALPSVHAMGLSDGVACISADARIDARLRRLSHELGIRIRRIDDPPRASSGKCVRIGSAAARG